MHFFLGLFSRKKSSFSNSILDKGLIGAGFRFLNADFDLRRKEELLRIKKEEVGGGEGACAGIEFVQVYIQWSWGTKFSRKAIRTSDVEN